MRVQVIELKLYDQIISFLLNIDQPHKFRDVMSKEARRLLTKLQQSAGEDHGTEVVKGE